MKQPTEYLLARIAEQPFCKKCGAQHDWKTGSRMYFKTLLCGTCNPHVPKAERVKEKQAAATDVLEQWVKVLRTSNSKLVACVEDLNRRLGVLEARVEAAPRTADFLEGLDLVALREMGTSSRLTAMPSANW